MSTEKLQEKSNSDVHGKNNGTFKSLKKNFFNLAEVVHEISKNRETFFRELENKRNKSEDGQGDRNQEYTEKSIGKNNTSHMTDEQILRNDANLLLISTIEEEAEEIESLNQDTENDETSSSSGRAEETDTIKLIIKQYEDIKNDSNNISPENQELDMSKTDPDQCKTYSNSQTSVMGEMADHREEELITRLDINKETVNELDCEKDRSSLNEKDKSCLHDKEKSSLNDKNKSSLNDKGKINLNEKDEVDGLVKKQEIALASLENKQVNNQQRLREHESETILQAVSNDNDKIEQYGMPLVKFEEYNTRAKVNKLQIPDKFMCTHDMECKDLKNLLNTSSKNKCVVASINYQELVPKIKHSVKTEKDDTKLKNDNFNNNCDDNPENRDAGVLKEDTVKGNHAVVLREETVRAKILTSSREKQGLKSEKYAKHGNVRKLLENYQHKQKPAEPSRVSNGNSVRNLHGKIKQLPENINIRHEYCNLSNQKPNIKQNNNSENLPEGMNEKIFFKSNQQELERFDDLLKNNSHSNSFSPTSPICDLHIDPEVTYRRMSVAEKRKV